MFLEKNRHQNQTPLKLTTSHNFLSNGDCYPRERHNETSLLQQNYPECLRFLHNIEWQYEQLLDNFTSQFYLGTTIKNFPEKYLLLLRISSIAMNQQVIVLSANSRSQFFHYNMVSMAHEILMFVSKHTPNNAVRPQSLIVLSVQQNKYNNAL